MSSYVELKKNIGLLLTNPLISSSKCLICSLISFWNYFYIFVCIYSQFLILEIHNLINLSEQISLLVSYKSIVQSI